MTTATIAQSDAGNGVVYDLTVMAAGGTGPLLGPAELDVPAAPGRWDRAMQAADALLAGEGWKRSEAWAHNCGEMYASVLRAVPDAASASPPDPRRVSPAWSDEAMHAVHANAAPHCRLCRAARERDIRIMRAAAALDAAVKEAGAAVFAAQAAADELIRLGDPQLDGTPDGADLEHELHAAKRNLRRCARITGCRAGTEK